MLFPLFEIVGDRYQRPPIFAWVYISAQQATMVRNAVGGSFAGWRVEHNTETGVIRLTCSVTFTFQPAIAMTYPEGYTVEEVEMYIQKMVTP